MKIITFFFPSPTRIGLNDQMKNKPNWGSSLKSETTHPFINEYSLVDWKDDNSISTGSISSQQRFLIPNDAKVFHLPMMAIVESKRIKINSLV